MNHIKELRLEKGLTLKQVSELSGIYIRQIQKYESGEYDTNKMTLKNAIGLADALGCDVRQLLKEEEKTCMK